MLVEFRRRQLERCALNRAAAIKKWGPDVGSRYPDCIAELLAAPSWEALEALHVLGLHPLAGDRQGQYAIRITGQWRIIIERGDGPDELIVLNVEDYHR